MVSDRRRECDRCSRQIKRNVQFVPNGHLLGPECTRLLERRSKLRSTGDTPNHIYRCKVTKTFFGQSEQFDTVCPALVSCWACEYMLKKTCLAEEVKND